MIAIQTLQAARATGTASAWTATPTASHTPTLVPSATATVSQTAVTVVGATTGGSSSGLGNKPHGLVTPPPGGVLSLLGWMIVVATATGAAVLAAGGPEETGRRLRALLDRWGPQPQETESAAPPRPSIDQKRAQHAIEWARYAQAFINGGRRIGTFSRRAMCAQCPQEVERRQYDDEVFYGPLVTDRDWREVTNALKEAGLMFSSRQGTDLMPGVSVRDVYEFGRVTWPRYRCPVVRYIDPQAKNWTLLTDYPTPNGEAGGENTVGLPKPTTPT